MKPTKSPFSSWLSVGLLACGGVLSSSGMLRARGDSSTDANAAVRDLIDIAGKGGNYLPNVGPTSEGVVPLPEADRLRQMGDRPKVNGEAIYAAASPFARQLPWGRRTMKVSGDKTTLYLHVWDWPADGKLLVPELKNRIETAYLLEDGQKLSVESSEVGAVISLPTKAPDNVSRPIVLRFTGQPFRLADTESLATNPAPSPATVERRTDAIVSRMTLGQKIDLLGGVDGFYVRGYPKLGWPSLRMADGPMGVRNGGPATAYPGGIALAATWDSALAGRIGASLGRDARAKGVNFLLGPGVNIYRGPLDGRNFEYFGEDPYLGARIAVDYIEGVQSQGVVATIKHFVANNSEFARQSIDERISERAEHEIYLPIFEAAVKEAHVGAVMDAYNLVNREHMTQNAPLNVDVLKNAWRFDGIVMSDWSATHDGVAAANGGLDLEMPSGRYMNQDTLLPAIRDGRVSIATIDDKVRRIVSTAIRFGFLDRPQQVMGEPRFSERDRKVALDGALESVVLLKNAGSVLPLSRSTVTTIAVLGPNAYPGLPVGGGSAGVTPFVAVSPLEGISRELAGRGRVLYDPGIPSPKDIMARTSFSVDPKGREPGLREEYYHNVDFSGKPAVRVDRCVDFDWHEAGFPPNAADGASIRWAGYLRPSVSGPYTWYLHVPENDRGRLYLDGRLISDPPSGRAAISNVDTLLEAGRCYQVTFELAIKSKLGWGGGFGMGVIAQAAIVSPEARRMAAAADAAVVFIGFNAGTEGEGYDRPFALDPAQDELVREIAAANPHTIVVLNAGGSVDVLPWIDRVPAVLDAWYTGQESGTAIAKILFGETNPSGRLPITFERRWSDNPTYDSWYPQDHGNTVVYKEGVFVGYRGFEHSGIRPLFPFGYGLSYTTFSFSGLTIAPTSPAVGEPVTVSFTVTNTGRRAGADVAQVYLGNPGASVPRPHKELKGFSRVDLRPGESRRLTMTLDRRAMSFWDVISHGWREDPGQFTVYVGDSSEHVPLCASYSVKAR